MYHLSYKVVYSVIFAYRNIIAIFRLFKPRNRVFYGLCFMWRS